MSELPNVKDIPATQETLGYTKQCAGLGLDVVLGVAQISLNTAAHHDKTAVY